MAEFFYRSDPDPAKKATSPHLYREYVNFIQFLILNDVDIDAVTLKGDTISNLIYRNEAFPFNAWEDALALCGYDAIEVLTKHLYLSEFQPSEQIHSSRTAALPSSHIQELRVSLRWSGSEPKRLQRLRNCQAHRRGRVFVMDDSTGSEELKIL